MPAIITFDAPPVYLFATRLDRRDGGRLDPTSLSGILTNLGYPMLCQKNEHQGVGL